jgi:hypothetical protein
MAALALAFGLAASGAWAQTGDPPPKPWATPSKDPRDLSGVYVPTPPGVYRFKPIDGSEIPFQPWAKAEWDRRESARQNNAPIANTSTQCLPSGIPRVLTAPYPIKILTTPKEVVMLHEVMHLIRVIFMNEEHPKNIYPTFMGHSVGRWEGDTLVVDTVGFHPLATLDQGDLPKSDALRVTERYRKINGGKQIEGLITIDDAKTYTKPWTARVSYDFRPDIRFIEYICEENNRNPVGADGVVGAK